MKQEFFKESIWVDQNGWIYLCFSVNKISHGTWYSWEGGDPTNWKPMDCSNFEYIGIL